jgi:hypothetical protein
MSLKHFHLVFILLSTVVTLWYGFWELSMIGSGSTAGHIARTGMSLILSGGLIYYLIKVIQKFRRISA